jgi:hypothetical protein
LKVTKVPAGPTKPVPVTVMVTLPLPTGAVLGVTLIRVMGCAGGVGWPAIDKITALEVCEPFCAVMVAPPLVAIKVAGTVALTVLGLEKVVESDEPFQKITVPVVNPVPVTLRVNDGPPACTDDGDVLVMVRPFRATKARALETRLAFVAVMDAEIGCAIRVAGMVAVS